MTVFEEAAYLAMHSPLKMKVWMKARENVKKMRRYEVRECKFGKDVRPWQEIFANSDDEAATKLVSGQLRRTGKPGELRVRVRPVGDLKNQTLFYADALDHE